MKRNMTSLFEFELLASTVFSFEETKSEELKDYLGMESLVRAL